jgi:hypothetical protein
MSWRIHLEPQIANQLLMMFFGRSRLLSEKGEDGPGWMMMMMTEAV